MNRLLQLLALPFITAIIFTAGCHSSSKTVEHDRVIVHDDDDHHYHDHDHDHNHHWD